MGHHRRDAVTLTRAGTRHRQPSSCNRGTPRCQRRHGGRSHGRRRRSCTVHKKVWGRHRVSAGRHSGAGAGRQGSNTRHHRAAPYLRVLGDLNLLHQLTQRGTVTRAVLPANSDFPRALSLHSTQHTGGRHRSAAAAIGEESGRPSARQSGGQHTTQTRADGELPPELRRHCTVEITKYTLAVAAGQQRAAWTHGHATWTTLH